MIYLYKYKKLIVNMVNAFDLPYHNYGDKKRDIKGLANSIVDFFMISYLSNGEVEFSIPDLCSTFSQSDESNMEEINIALGWLINTEVLERKVFYPSPKKDFYVSRFTFNPDSPHFIDFIDSIDG